MNSSDIYLADRTNMNAGKVFMEPEKSVRGPLKAKSKKEQLKQTQIPDESVDFEMESPREKRGGKDLSKKRMHKRNPSANIPYQMLPKTHFSQLNNPSNYYGSCERIDDVDLMAEENIFDNPSPKKRKPADSSPPKFDHLPTDSNYSNSRELKPQPLRPKFLSDQKSTSTSTMSEESLLLECNESLYCSSELSEKGGSINMMGVSPTLMGSTNENNIMDLQMRDISRTALQDRTEDMVFGVERDLEEDFVGVVDMDTLNYLIARESQYSPDPYYFERSQPHVTWTMRVILMDWMMEVCMEFTLKRETYHYAVNYVDRYLSYIPNVAKVELQLVGVTSMYIAAKMEEIYAPKIVDFAKSTDNGYNSEQIQEMEYKMLSILKWELVPPTLNMWGNWYMNQWDIYLETNVYAQNHQLLRIIADRDLFFKQPNEKAYARFREMMQILDIAILDIITLQYQPRAIIAATMYLLMGHYMEQFTLDKIAQEFMYGSSFLDPDSLYNDLFSDFLGQSFGFQIPELLPTIQYVASFMSLPFNYDLPSVAQNRNVLEGHFEEFLAYQTHHPMNIDYIRKKQR